MARLTFKKVGGREREFASVDEPVPAIMADGLGGVCRRGWQYALEGAAPTAIDGVVPREAWTPRDHPEFFRVSRIMVEEANGQNSVGLGRHRELDVTEKPMPTVQAGRPVRVRAAPGAAPPADDDSGKPPYRVPSMDEIAAVPHCGLDVVSTFSGCGGTCLGYRMAGYRVLWASEFVDAARECYLANYPETPVDPRDVRIVEPAEILERIGKAVGEVDVLEGSPPCASFSTAGRRHRHWGQVRKYSDRQQRTDDLFLEFARLVDGVRPRAFVAENVSGLVKGAAKGYFLEILAALKACGYRVKCRMLDAQWLGVPQSRQRVFFVGVREDLDVEPAFPSPLPHRYSLREACPWIASCVHDTSGLYGAGEVADRPTPAITVGVNAVNRNHFKVEADADISRFEVGREWGKLRPGQQSSRYHQLVRASPDKPVGTVTAEGGNASLASVTHPTERRKFTIAELKRVCSFPDDFELTGTYAQQWERLGRSVPPLMARAIAETLRDEVLLPCRGR